SIFVYKAYYDDRAMMNTIRILAISKCLHAKAKIEIDVNGVISPLSGYPIEGKCPWKWAKRCAWNSYELRSKPVIDVPDQVITIVGIQLNLRFILLCLLFRRL
ncbi:hypothetical protein PMAYCL1PPCAC_00270, partial [Pristionchus mayeri]